MAGERVVIPASRDVRGTLDGGDTTDCVVACPPHPEMGGSRADPRIRAVTEALVDVDIATLRFDYGPWDQGMGECQDAVAAVQWAFERFELVGLFGYSFGAAVAIHAAGRTPVTALSVLAPPASIESLDTVEALEGVSVPIQLIVGERDDTVDWRPVVDAVGSVDSTVEHLDTDHSFVGRQSALAGLTGDFFRLHL